MTDDEGYLCARCSRELRAGRGELYVIRIDAVADPSPPVITEEDLAQDIGAEIRRLIAQMNDITEREAMDQVCRRLTLYLCPACYARWIEDPVSSN
jgi:hypothetical protein